VIFPVYFIVTTIPILFGAVRPWVWSVYTVLIFLTYILALWQDGFRETLVMGWAGRIVLGFFFAWSVFQLAPLPPAVLSFLSPVKYGHTVQAFSLIDRSLSWQTISYSVRISLAETAFYLGLYLFYRLFSTVIRDAAQLKTMVIIVLLIGTAEALYGIVQALVPAAGVLWVDATHAYFGMARGTYINRNNFAGFMEMGIPITLGFAMAVSYWPVRGKLRQILAHDRLNQTIFIGMILVVMLLALVFSQSRAGIMGGALALLAFFGVSRVAVKKSSAPAWVLVGVIVSLFLAYGLSIGFEPVIERFLRIDQNTGRLDIWKDTWSIAREHPLGVGPGNYEHVYPVYQVHFNPRLRVLDAHNDFLQVLAESGWPGFAALAGGFLYFLVSRLAGIVKSNPDADPFSFFIRLGALCGLFALFFHSFFDFNLQIPANTVYFVGMMAFCNLNPKSKQIQSMKS